MRDILRYQIWQLLVAFFLVVILYYCIVNNVVLLKGNLLGISTKNWFWLAILIPIIHQFYVVLMWRLELYKQYFTSRFGLKKAFNLYTFGFSVLFASRLVFIIILAISDKNSLEINPIVSYIFVAIITPIVIFLFYSVSKYFTKERAYGIDHFDKNYNEPFEKRGIFKYSNNAMYVYGLMILYLPGLLLFSKTALIVALFNHLFIWAHYFFTELPDMKYIYGKSPFKEK